MHREKLVLEDGGEVALDWAYQKEGANDLTDTTPILLILAGITGNNLDLRFLSAITNVHYIGSICAYHDLTLCNKCENAFLQ